VPPVRVAHLGTRPANAPVCELAVREAVPGLLDGDLEAMREANHRFTAALESGDVEAALRADDESHGVLVRIAGNRALATVLEQFTPTVRRAERLRFASLRGRGSVRQHDELIRLCATGGTPRMRPPSPTTPGTACRAPRDDHRGSAVTAR
jgi:DNA-binding GntR family transcriptional regulator